MIRSHRPFETLPRHPLELYGRDEFDRREKWLERQRRSGNTDACLEDAPPAFGERTSARPEDWVTACETCRGRDFDIRYTRRGRFHLERYCVQCDALAARRALRKLLGHPPCTFDGCSFRARYWNGRFQLCSTHIRQLSTRGDVALLTPIGEPRPRAAS